MWLRSRTRFFLKPLVTGTAEQHLGISRCFWSHLDTCFGAGVCFSLKPLWFRDGYTSDLLYCSGSLEDLLSTWPRYLLPCVMCRSLIPDSRVMWCVTLSQCVAGQEGQTESSGCKTCADSGEFASDVQKFWIREVSLDLEDTTLIANISGPGFQARNKTCFELHGKQDTAATRAPLEASAPQASATVEDAESNMSRSNVAATCIHSHPFLAVFLCVLIALHILHTFWGKAQEVLLLLLQCQRQSRPGPVIVADWLLKDSWSHSLHSHSRSNAPTARNEAFAE